MAITLFTTVDNFFVVFLAEGKREVTPKREVLVRCTFDELRLVIILNQDFIVTIFMILEQINCGVEHEVTTDFDDHLLFQVGFLAYLFAVCRRPLFENSCSQYSIV